MRLNFEPENFARGRMRDASDRWGPKLAFTPIVSLTLRRVSFAGRFPNIFIERLVTASETNMQPAILPFLGPRSEGPAWWFTIDEPPIMT